MSARLIPSSHILLLVLTGIVRDLEDNCMFIYPFKEPEIDLPVLTQTCFSSKVGTCFVTLIRGEILQSLSVKLSVQPGMRL